jgi:hypothetical protein
MMKFFLMLLTLSLTSIYSHANSWQNFHQWPLVGKTTFKVLFFEIYHIELRTADGHYNTGTGLSHPLGIKIHYQRDIKRDKLVEKTLEQWRDLGIKHPDMGIWAEQLKGIWPDINKGDFLLYSSNGDTGDFYYQAKRGMPEYIGSISEPVFNQAFLSVWLSPDTQFSSLRRQLIGAN